MTSEMLLQGQPIRRVLRPVWTARMPTSPAPISQDCQDETEGKKIAAIFLLDLGGLGDPGTAGP